MLKDYCRLCANKKSDLFPIFDGKTDESSLSYRIRSNLHLTILERELLLPLRVCQACIETLDGYCMFIEKCRAAQVQLNCMLLSSCNNGNENRISNRLSCRELVVLLPRLPEIVVSDVKDEVINSDRPRYVDSTEELDIKEENAIVTSPAVNCDSHGDLRDQIDVSCDIKYKDELQDFLDIPVEKTSSNGRGFTHDTGKRKDDDVEFIFSSRANKKNGASRNYLKVHLTTKQLSSIPLDVDNKESLKKLGRKIFRKLALRFENCSELDFGHVELLKLMNSLKKDDELPQVTDVTSTKASSAESTSTEPESKLQLAVDNSLFEKAPVRSDENPSAMFTNESVSQSSAPTDKEMADVPIVGDVEEIESAAVVAENPLTNLKVPKLILTRVMNDGQSNVFRSNVGEPSSISEDASGVIRVEQANLLKSEVLMSPNTSKNNVIKRGIECNLCHQFLGSKKKLDKHIVREHKSDLMACEHCSYVTSHRYRLSQHLKEVHDKSYECRICGKMLGKRSKLRLHFSVEHVALPTPIECEVCKESFTQRYYYKLHMKTHTEDAQWACPHCKLKFELKHKLEMHISRYHTKKKTVRCLKCSFVAIHKYHLTQHNREVHEKRFICDICGKQESKKSRIAVHIMKKHFPKKEYQCKICQAVYTSKAWYFGHMKKHK